MSRQHDTPRDDDPEWLKKWRMQAKGELPMPPIAAVDGKDEHGRWKKGVSGNPLGNLHGKTKAQKLREDFENNAEGVRAVVIECALKGDMQAASLVLARACAPLRPAREKTPFKLDTTKPLASQAAAVVQAVADGDLAAADAQIVMACLGTYAAIVQSDEIDARLAALESAAHIKRARGGIIELEDMHSATPGTS